MKRTLLCLLFALISCFGYAQSFDWGITLGGTSKDDRSNKVDVDQSGNVYLIGAANNGAKFGGFTLSSQGGRDIYLTKLDCQKNVSWLASIGGIDNEPSECAVFVDNAGYVYATGGYSLYGVITSADGSTYSLPSNKGQADVFTAKFSSDGILIWVQTGNGGGDDTPNEIHVDDNGHLAIVGHYGYSSSDITFGSTTLSSANGGYDMFTAVYDTAGTLQWARSDGGNGDDWATGVAIDDAGYLYTCGQYGYGGTNCKVGGVSLSTKGGWEGYIAKFDLSTGANIWAVAQSSSLNEGVSQIVLDNLGNIYACGVFSKNSVIYSTTNSSYKLPTTYSNYVYIMKYDTAGNYIKINYAGASTIGQYYDIDINPDKNRLVVTGFTTSSVDIDAKTYSSSASYNLIAVVWDSALTAKNVQFVSGGGANLTYGMGVQFAPTAGYYVSGFFQDNLPLSTSTKINSSGSFDPFIEHFCTSSEVTLKTTSLYTCASPTISTKQNRSAFTIDWYKDGSALNTSGSSYQTTAPGQYYIHMYDGCCIDTYSDTITISDLNVGQILPNDTTLCSNSLIIKADGQFDTYAWSDGSNGNSITATQSGIYWLTVTKGGCSFTDSITVNLSGINDVLPTGVAICAGSTATLDAGNAGASYLWSTTETTQTIQVTQSGTYSVIVSLNGCSKQFSCKVETINTAVNLGADTTICSSITLDAGSGADYYIWTTGATSQTITVSQTGWYGAVYYKNGCYGYDSIYVTNSAVSVNLPDSLFICKGSTATLDAGNAGATYAWSDGSTNQTLVVDESGVYEVVVTNGPCTGDGRTVVTVLDMKVNLGADTMACSAYYLDAGNPGCTYLWDDGSTAQTRLVSNDGTYYVTVTSHGCSATDSINVVVGMDKPTITDSLGTLVSSSFDNNQWYKNGLEFAGATERTFNPPASGYYKVCVSNNNDCTVCSDSIYINVTGISSLQPVNVGLTVYPNPTQGSVQVKFNANERLTVELINAEGALVYKGQQLVSGDAISLQHLPNGIYLMRYSTSTAQGAMRLIKQ